MEKYNKKYSELYYKSKKFIPSELNEKHNINFKSHILIYKLQYMYLFMFLIILFSLYIFKPSFLKSYNKKDKKKYVSITKLILYTLILWMIISVGVFLFLKTYKNIL